MTSQAMKAESTLNGLSPEALTSAAEAIAQDPTQGLVSFRTKTSWLGQLRTQSDVESYEIGGQRVVRRHRMVTDEPLEILGSDTAPNPQELLLAALNACMAVGFVVGATKAGIRLDRLEIESELSLDMRGAFGLDPNVPAGTERIRYTVKVSGTGTPAQFEEIHREVMANSPNRFHLTQPIPLESKLIIS